MAPPKTGIAHKISSIKTKQSSKRKVQDNINLDETPEKRISKKKVKSDFTDLDFKLQLKDPNTSFSALDEFTTQVENYEQGKTKYDIIEAYCRGSPECNEIFGLLEAGKRKTSELCSITTVLNCILVRLSDDLPKLQPVALATARRILGQHLGAVYALLGMKNKSGQIKVALRLLMAMVLQGPDMARLVVMQFDLSHYTVAPLLQRRDAKDPSDVRTCLLQFMMSLLVTGDEVTIKLVVETKGFLNGMFVGMTADKVPTLQMVLPTLKEKVVESPFLTKTSKIRLFNPSVLQALGKLYNWKGPASWSELKQRKQTPEEVLPEEEAGSEEKEIVQQLVHSLLLALTCPFKTGINFHDKTLGTGQKNMNQVLTSLLKSLQRPYSSPLESVLVSEVLKACPDQLIWYLPSLKHALVPRASTNWIQAMQLLIKVFSSQPDVSPAMSLPDKASVPVLTKMVLGSLLPPKDIWLQVTKGLQFPHRSVQHTSLQLLQCLIQRVKATLAACGKPHTLYTLQELGDMAQSLQDLLLKLLPSVGVLLKLWQSAVSGKDIGSDSTLTDEERKGTTPDNISIPDMPVVGMVPYLLSLLQVISCYQEALPTTFTNQPLNLGPLVEGVLKVQASDQSEDTEEESRLASLLRLQLLRLLATASSHQVAWMKESLGGRTTIALLLEMTASTTRGTHLHDAACHLLGKLLCSTSLFEHSPHEVDIWLRTLGQVKTKHRPIVIAFLEKCLIMLIKSPYQWADKVSELMAEAAAIDMGAVSDVGSVMSQDTTVECILSLDDETLVLEKGTSAAPTSSVQPAEHVQFPFSCLLPVALEEAKLGIKEGVHGYLDLVLLEVFCHQRDPRVLSLLLHASCHKTGLKLANLANVWLPKKMQMQSCDGNREEGGGSRTLTELLRRCLIGNCAPDITAIESIIDDQPLIISEADKVLRYLLLMVKHRIALQLQHVHKGQENLTACLNLLKRALQRLKDCEEEDVAIDIELMPLLPQKQTKRDICEGLYRTVLCDPDMQYYYLWKPDPDTAGTVAKASMQVSSTVSVHLSDILGNVPKDMQESLQDCIQIYVVKVLHHLSQCCGDDTVLLSEDFTSTVKSVVVWCSTEELLWMAEQILRIPFHMRHNSQLDGLSPWHDVLRVVLLQVAEKTTCSSAAHLSPAVINSLSDISKVCCHLDATIVALFRQKSHCCLAIKKDYLIHCLHTNSKLKAELTLVLVQYSAACRRWFLEHIKEHKSLKNKKFCENYIASALTCYVMMEDTVSQCLIAKPYWSDLSTFSIESLEENFVKWAFLYELTKNITMAAAHGLWKQLTVHVSGSLKVIPQQLAYLTVLTKRLASLRSEHGMPCKASEGLVNCLLKALTHQCQHKGKQNQKTCILSELLSCMKVLVLSPDVLRHQLQDHWDNLLKSCLRVLMRTPSFLDILQKLVPFLYGANSAAVVQLYQMLVSHSAFIDIMLGDESLVKTSLVNLLLMLVQLSSECCQATHLGMLFGAYRASLSATDQSILLLLRTYENSGVRLAEFRPYLWGPAAAEQHALRKSLGPSLTKQPTTAEVLDALDKERLKMSALSMPLTRQMQGTVVYENVQLPEPAAVYDPAFLLPLFSQLLAPEMLIKCRDFVACNALGYTFAALSCHDPGLRGVAYRVLTCFEAQLEGARFAEKPQVTYLLECLKNSVDTSGAKLAPLLGVYLLCAAELLLLPGQHMFTLVTSFLLLKPTLDLTSVPDFSKLFNSAAQEFNEERSWVLSLLEEGLRETADYRIAENRFTFKLLLSFYDSALCSQDKRLQILRILRRACELKSVGFDLVKHHGLLAWLSGALSNSGSDKDLMGTLVEILCSLWQSQLGDRDHPTAQEENTQQSKTGSCSRSCLPVVFTNEMLQIMLLVASLARPSLSQFSRYIKCLASILSHLDKTAQLARGSLLTLVSVRPSTLHCLLLAWHWGHHYGKQELVKQMEEYLAACGAEDVLPSLQKGCSSVGSVGRTDKALSASTNEHIANNTVDEKGDLEALLRVFCHWHLSVVTLAGNSINSSHLERTKPCVVKAIVLGMAQWAFTVLQENFAGHLELQVALARWFAEICIRNKASLCPVLLGSQTCSKEITSLLLNLYNSWMQHQSINDRTSVEDEASQWDWKDTLKNHSPDILQKKSLTEQLNRMFLIFMDIVNSEDQFKMHPLRTLLTSTVYQQVVQMLRQQPADVSPEALHYLIGSLWLTVPQPHHALALLTS